MVSAIPLLPISRQSTSKCSTEQGGEHRKAIMWEEENPCGMQEDPGHGHRAPRRLLQPFDLELRQRSPLCCRGATFG